MFGFQLGPGGPYLGCGPLLKPLSKGDLPGLQIHVSTDIDGTGLKLDCTVPASGTVLINASVAYAITGPAGLYLGLKASGTDVVGTASRVGYIGASGTGIQGTGRSDGCCPA